jgi:hypothetical protein
MTALSEWENFYVIVGSSAGALIGLQFVVITLIAAMPIGRGTAQAGAAFSTPNVVHFGAVLLLAGILSAPWHEIAGAEILWCVLGPQRHCVRDHRGPAYANTRYLQARVRGLVVSCSAAIGGVCRAGLHGVHGWISFTRGAVWHWSRGIAAVVYWHSQCMGCGYVSCVCETENLAANYANDHEFF